MSRPVIHGAAAALATVALLATRPVQAQQDIPLRWHVVAGFNQPVGQTSDLLQGGGYAVGGGFSYKPQRSNPLSLRVDFSYTDNRATRQLLDSGAQQAQAEVDDGHGYFASLTANAVYQVPFGRGVRGYGIAGIGVYHADISLTQRVLYGGTYCDPYWGYCYPGLAAGDLVVAQQTTTKLGWNAGVGVEFPRYYGQAWFIEARYNRIEASTPIEYIPITIGYRF